MSTKSEKMWKKIFDLLPSRQKLGFFCVLIILGVSAVLSQFTPLAIGYLTDSVLAGEQVAFWSVVPILIAILAVNVINEIIKVVRRLIVEDTATQAEKKRAAKSRYVTAAGTAFLLPQPYDRQYPRQAQPQSGRYGQAD
ncbi:hypothetical protein [uncultured Agathobaculum sp.]|uniref:hypothetical protein n=1 Tax=uncultured Agathobaculum sp. TaxID=2048140 RepID=UPI003207F0B7